MPNEHDEPPISLTVSGEFDEGRDPVATKAWDNI